MKFKVYKVTLDKKQTLEYQLEVGEVRPGTDECELAVEYVLVNVPHENLLAGEKPLMDSDGVHLTKWLVLDDTDIYWFIPGGHFRKSPEPIKVERPSLCRVGYCAKSNVHYQGAARTMLGSFRKGICPICGGKAEKL